MPIFFKLHNIIEVKVILFYLVMILASFIYGCGPAGTFFDPTLGLHLARVVVAGGTANSLAIYDINGNFIQRLRDYNVWSDVPRNVLAVDYKKFLVVVDGVDRIEEFDLTTGPRTWAANAQYGGAATLGDVAKDSAGSYYAIETTTNTIEKFDASGNRQPLSGATPFIATILGSCTLSGASNLTVIPNGYLAVVSSTNARVNYYDISTATASCASSVTGAPYAAAGPKGILAHSNGKIYVGLNTSNTIVELDQLSLASTTIWAANTSVIQTVAGFAEMPDGTILVASQVTSSIERITTAGVRVGTTPFIKDAYTAAVNSVIVLRGSN